MNEPALENTPIATSTPTVLQRWLGAVPIFASFAMLGWYLMRHEQLRAFFRVLRVDLPLPTLWALHIGAFVSKYPVLLLPAMLAPLWIYFGWAAKKNGRLFWFNLLAFALCMLFALTFVSGPALPYFKIQSALRK